MTQLRYGKLVGWGAYTPEKVLTNFDLEKMMDTSNEWIVQRTGIQERHIAGEGETTATMAIKAAERALETAELSGDDIDLIIVANTAPDYLTPPVSSQVQTAISDKMIPAFVLEAGCTGFVYGLNTAYQFLQTGAYERIMVVGVEMLSRHIDWNDRSVAVLFGDGAGAVILEATDEPCGVLGFQMGSDGRHVDKLWVPAGGTAEPTSHDALDNGRQLLHMDGQAVFRFASRIIGPSCRAALDQAGLTFDDIDLIIPHQANLRIVQSAARDMGIPMDKFFLNIHKYANTSAASIPLAMTEAFAEGKLKLGDTILVVAFGAGLTWASAVWQLTPEVVEQFEVAVELEMLQAVA